MKHKSYREFVDEVVVIVGLPKTVVNTVALQKLPFAKYEELLMMLYNGRSLATALELVNES